MPCMAKAFYLNKDKKKIQTVANKDDLQAANEINII